ncbi:MAG: radical SAM protein [Thermoplasma acidophilum]|nr:radical SAM protein [Thermoplasma acidophilum]
MNFEGLLFGPVPSRRLGFSLGVNNIPRKICSYSCVYCQIGRTINFSIKRQGFYSTDDILDALTRKIEEVRTGGGRIDYVTFVPDGEPTLDVNLGKHIEAIKSTGMKVAVISNASLIDNEDVASDLMDADWVSLKVDAIDDVKWKIIDRPYGSLNHSIILDGIRKFSEKYHGILATETMLVDGIQDLGEIHIIAEYLSSLRKLDLAYISVPTRPPAEEYVKPPSDELINAAFQVFNNHLGNTKVSLLTGYEGSEFFTGKSLEDEILNILAVHPMREDALLEVIERSGESAEFVDHMVKYGKISKVPYMGRFFYILPPKIERIKPNS